MVHALRKVHSLLKPGGTLIDICPTGEPPAFEVHVDEYVTRAGWYQETDDFGEYFQAHAALREAIESGLFVVARAEIFEFLTHANTVAELRDYLLAEYSDAIIDEETVRLAEGLYHAPGQHKRVVLRETAIMTRLRRA